MRIRGTLVIIFSTKNNDRSPLTSLPTATYRIHVKPRANDVSIESNAIKLN